MPGKDVILDPTLQWTLAVLLHATTTNLENVADPDKEVYASPKEDVTLLVLADLPFLKENTKFVEKPKFATAKVPALSSPLEFKLAFVIQ